MAKSTTLQAAVRDVLRPPFCTSFTSVTTDARNDNKEPGKTERLIWQSWEWFARRRCSSRSSNSKKLSWISERTILNKLSITFKNISTKRKIIEVHYKSWNLRQYCKDAIKAVFFQNRRQTTIKFMAPWTSRRSDTVASVGHRLRLAAGLTVQSCWDLGGNVTKRRYRPFL